MTDANLIREAVERLENLKPFITKEAREDLETLLQLVRGVSPWQPIDPKEELDRDNETIFELAGDDPNERCLWSPKYGCVGVHSNPDFGSFRPVCPTFTPKWVRIALPLPQEESHG